MDLENLKYPIGKFSPITFDETKKLRAIAQIKNFPSMLRNATKGLNKQQLDTPYRPKGWTVRQVVHHCADSHMNAYIRFKLALTEDQPNIRPYEEALWAEGAEYDMDIDISLMLLDAVHARWFAVLENMSDDDFQRTYYHPAAEITTPMSVNLQHYEWHCQHHLTHLTELVKREKWT